MQTTRFIVFQLTSFLVFFFSGKMYLIWNNARFPANHTRCYGDLLRASYRTTAEPLPPPPAQASKLSHCIGAVYRCLCDVLEFLCECLDNFVLKTARYVLRIPSLLYANLQLESKKISHDTLRWSAKTCLFTVRFSPPELSLAINCRIFLDRLTLCATIVSLACEFDLCECSVYAVSHLHVFFLAGILCIPFDWSQFGQKPYAMLCSNLPVIFSSSFRANTSSMLLCHQFCDPQYWTFIN